MVKELLWSDLKPLGPNVDVKLYEDAVVCVWGRPTVCTIKKMSK
jgi:hypothetical protein